MWKGSLILAKKFFLSVVFDYFFVGIHNKTDIIGESNLIPLKTWETNSLFKVWMASCRFPQPPGRRSSSSFAAAFILLLHGWADISGGEESEEAKRSKRWLFSAKNVSLFHHYLSEDAGGKKIKAEAVCVRKEKLEFGFSDDSEQNQSVWVLRQFSCNLKMQEGKKKGFKWPRANCLVFVKLLYLQFHHAQVRIA